jgi:hypothetical protein
MDCAAIAGGDNVIEPKIYAALEINKAGRVPELHDRLAAAYRQWKLQSMDQPGGAKLWAALLVKDICIDSADRTDWTDALMEAAWPSWQSVEAQVILEFAAELKPPPAIDRARRRA